MIVCNILKNLAVKEIECRNVRVLAGGGCRSLKYFKRVKLDKKEIISEFDRNNVI